MSTHGANEQIPNAEFSARPIGESGSVWRPYGRVTRRKEPGGNIPVKVDQPDTGLRILATRDNLVTTRGRHRISRRPAAEDALDLTFRRVDDHAFSPGPTAERHQSRR